jgi:hypothetical protein
MFNKDMLLDNNNKIKWKEIHITQFIIHPKFLKDLSFNDGYHRTIEVCIKNFCENMDIVNDISYTIKLLDITRQYIYNNTYSSRITNNSNFIEKDYKFGLDIDIKIDNENINNYFSVEDNFDETIFEIELYFK